MSNANNTHSDQPATPTSKKSARMNFIVGDKQVDAQEFWAKLETSPDLAKAVDEPPGTFPFK